MQRKSEPGLRRHFDGDRMRDRGERADQLRLADAFLAEAGHAVASGIRTGRRIAANTSVRSAELFQA